MKVTVIAALGLALLFVGARVGRTALRASAYPAFWLDLMSQPVAPNAIRLVALGDSSV